MKKCFKAPLTQPKSTYGRSWPGALNAVAVIVAHNHPSGLCKPSKNDKVLTKRLQLALSLVEVRLLDHLIIADNEVFSMLH